MIFSGAGTDGARGCQAIRTAGGTVFVQDPQTAEFDSMPLAAIATGQADAVLSPEDIAAELLKLQGNGQAAANREAPITPEEFDGFFRLLQEKTGSRFNHYKKSVVSRRIKRRMYLHGLPTVKEYLDLVSTSDAEAALLASDLMIGVTSFFRDRVAWKALNLEAVRKIAAENTSASRPRLDPCERHGRRGLFHRHDASAGARPRREKTGCPGLCNGRERPRAGAGARGQVSREHHRGRAAGVRAEVLHVGR